MVSDLFGMTNTEIERIGLDAPLNMSDGHARQPLDSIQLELLRDVNSLLAATGTTHQKMLETEFFHEYFEFCGQDTALGTGRTFLSYSASDELAIAAQVCRVTVQRILLLDPVFDNIRYFVTDQGLEVAAVLENQLASPDLIPWSTHGRDALFIVMPNNPTGFELDYEQFQTLCVACQSRSALLVIDASFRPGSRSSTWDMYAVLEDSGVDYYVIEDTGKTWPLHDLKVGIGVCSSSIYPEAYRRHDWLLLNVSPIILTFLVRLIRDSRIRGLEHTSGAAVSTNREIVHSMLLESSLEHVGNCASVPLELLRLPRNVDRGSFFDSCRVQGLELLPAVNYFWSKPLGEDMFRIPLARPVLDIERSCEVILRALQ